MRLISWVKSKLGLTPCSDQKPDNGFVISTQPQSSKYCKIDPHIGDTQLIHLKGSKFKQGKLFHLHFVPKKNVQSPTINWERNVFVGTHSKEVTFDVAPVNGADSNSDVEFEIAIYQSRQKVSQKMDSDDIPSLPFVSKFDNLDVSYTVK